MDNSSLQTPPAVDADGERPSLILGLIGGAAAMMICAVIWGAITYFTNYKIGYVAIGLGLAVGFAVKYLGRGNSFLLGLAAALLSLVGCMLGNLFFYCGILAREYGLGFVDVLAKVIFDPTLTLSLLKAGFEFMDLVFYALAIYFGFRMAYSLPRKTIGQAV
jgi:hypothetical protein